jgi:hypothetical protein
LDGADVQAIREVTRTAPTGIEPFATIDVSLLILLIRGPWIPRSDCRLSFFFGSEAPEVQTSAYGFDYPSVLLNQRRTTADRPVFLRRVAPLIVNGYATDPRVESRTSVVSSSNSAAYFVVLGSEDPSSLRSSG